MSRFIEIRKRHVSNNKIIHPVRTISPKINIDIFNLNNNRMIIELSLHSAFVDVLSIIEINNITRYIGNYNFSSEILFCNMYGAQQRVYRKCIYFVLHYFYWDATETDGHASFGLPNFLQFSKVFSVLRRTLFVPQFRQMFLLFFAGRAILSEKKLNTSLHFLRR